jgi:hypothetical protein
MWKSILLVASAAVFAVIGLVAGYFERSGGSLCMGAALGGVFGFLVGLFALPCEPPTCPQPPQDGERNSP